MDWFRIIHLNHSTLLHFVQNVDIFERIVENTERKHRFFDNFPFEELLDNSDNEDLILSIKVISVLSKYDDFYLAERGVNCCIEFVLTNMESPSMMPGELDCLIELLLTILKGCEQYVGLSNCKFDKERLLQNVLKLIKLPPFMNEETNENLYDILQYAFKIIDNVLNVKTIIQDLFETLIQKQKIADACLVCKLALNSTNTLPDDFPVMCNWLLHETPLMLSQQALSQNIVHEILACLSILTKKYVNGFVTYEGNETAALLKISNFICTYSSIPEMRENCFVILQAVLLDFFTENRLSHIPNIWTSLWRLPQYVSEWPTTKEGIFFCICHMMYLKSRLVWEKYHILRAMLKYFYSNWIYFHAINETVLNSMCFLYPALTNGTQLDLRTERFGNDLLDYFRKKKIVASISPNNICQLEWIFKDASNSMAVDVTCRYLNQAKDQRELNILSKALSNSDSEDVLLRVVLNEGTTRTFGEKAAFLLKITNNMKLSREIALKIPFFTDSPIVLRNLILSKPEVPGDEEQAILICGMMSCIIPMLDHLEVLKQACVFTTKLLVNVKTNPRSLVEYCRNIDNVKFLLDVLYKTDESVSVEITALFRVLISIQKMHRIEFAETLNVDFAPLLRGSSLKLSKSIKFLTSIQSSKKSLFVIAADDVFPIYSKILDHSFTPDVENECYDCIVVMLKRNTWLAQMPDTTIQLELICPQSEDTPKKENILKMVDVWLELIIKMPLNGFVIISTRHLRSFVMTADLDDRKLRHYLNVIDEIYKRQDVHFNIRR